MPYASDHGFSIEGQLPGGGEPQHFTKDFGSYVCDGDSITCVVDGITYSATLVRDPDTSPRDYDSPGWVHDTTDPENGERNREIIASWDRDEWHYFGIVMLADVSDAISLGDVGSVWGIEGNLSAGEDNPNTYFRTAANDMLPDAIKTAKGRLEALRHSTAMNWAGT